MAEHNWVRTIITDGQWCNRCGLPQAQWSGEPCPGEGAAEAVEARMVARINDQRGLVRQWVKDHAYAPDDIVLGSMTTLDDEGLTALHALLDAADPDWRSVL